MPKPDRIDYSDEDVHSAWVAEPPRLNSTVMLAEYDPRWPALYQREDERIRGILGERIIRLEHVGSTAVPGLCAKPIIDILLIVADSSDEATYMTDLENAGYQLVIREPDRDEHRAFKGPDTNVNLHVYSPATEQIERILAFRDRLRACDADRDLYRDTKRELAQRTWKYIQHYADAKTPVVDEIIERAQATQDPQYGFSAECAEHAASNALASVPPPGKPETARGVVKFGSSVVSVGWFS